MTSTNERLRVLLRVTLELYQRVNRIKEYLRSIGPGDSREYEQITAGIEWAIKRIETEVLDTLRQLTPLNALSDPDKLVVFLDVLTKFSRWFVKIHELLVYLPRQDVLFETFYTLENSFANHFEEFEPSIILGSVFNAFEFDFWEAMREKMPDLDEIGLSERNVVLQLAITDKNCPLAWGVLAHELGHAIDQKHRISEGVAAKFVTNKGSMQHELINNWAGELASDLIAAAVLGPASITSLTSMVYCLFPNTPLYSPSRTHPAMHHRLGVIGEYLRTKYYPWDSLESERKEFELAIEYSMEIAAKDDNQHQKIQKFDTIYEDLVRRLSKDVLIEIEKSIDLPEHTIECPSIQRCVKRLEDRAPVSAQGEDRKVLQKKLDAYQSETFENKEERGRAFLELTRLFREEPLAIQGILWSGRVRCDQLILAPIDRCLTADEGTGELIDKLSEEEDNRIPPLIEALQELDYLMISSINTSSVHCSPTLSSDAGVK